MNHNSLGYIDWQPTNQQYSPDSVAQSSDKLLVPFNIFTFRHTSSYLFHSFSS